MCGSGSIQVENKNTEGQIYNEDTFVYSLQARYLVFQSTDLGYAWSAAITKSHVTHLYLLSLLMVLA